MVFALATVQLCNSATAKGATTSGTPLTDLHFNLCQAMLAACV